MGRPVFFLKIISDSQENLNNKSCLKISRALLRIWKKRTMPDAEMTPEKVVGRLDTVRGSEQKQNAKKRKSSF